MMRRWGGGRGVAGGGVALRRRVDDARLKSLSLGAFSRAVLRSATLASASATDSLRSSMTSCRLMVWRQG